jgi:class 3 adenylate cyclase/tetratricopeptide (TPR) repeat protein
MHCPRCQHENSEDATFCDQCGARFEVACGRCGKTNRVRAKFCRDCGQSLVEVEDPVVSRFGVPRTYTPKHLAEKILTSRSVLEGERKQVTVLFADVKGSMELLADRDPEDARKILDPVLELMMEPIHRYEGTVSQVMGDGIMALFGAPIAHEDHAIRACYAALQIQEAAGRYRSLALREFGVPIHLRIGLNSGEVVVRSIGNDLHMDYTAVGQTTHLAARMEQIASPDSTLMTAATLRLAEGHVDTRALGRVPIKGLTDPVEVYELAGAAATRSRLQALAGRGLKRFVGRGPEMDRLRQALAQVKRGHGQVVATVGEPGVGKSRLYYELTRLPELAEWLVLDASALSYGTRTPYLPVIELIKGYFGTDETSGSVADKVRTRLLALDPALAPTLPIFLALLDQPVTDPGWQALDAAQRRERILDTLRRLWLRESEHRPVCLIVENLQWMDSETEAFLDILAKEISQHRVLLLVNYRFGYQHKWDVTAGYTELVIRPLSPEGGEELLEDLLGQDPQLDELKRHLIEQTDGNPFFMEESLRTLIETGSLVKDDATFRLTTPVVTLRVPPTVQAVLAARIDRLAPNEKELLQCAAAIGKRVPVALLERIADVPHDQAREALAHLLASEFLYETRLFPDLEYTFRHALTHEVAYASLLHGRRRELHAHVATAIEALYANRFEEHVEQLAEHAFLGELWAKAVTYLRRTGLKAFSRSAYHAAVARLEQALVALQHLPRTPDTIEQLIDVRLELRNALLPVGEPARVLTHLREAGELATAVGDSRRTGWVTAYTSACFWSTGRYPEALEAAKDARALAHEVGDEPLRAYASIASTWIAHSLGDYRAGVRAGSEAVDILQHRHLMERLPIPSLAGVLVRTWLVSCLAELGEFSRATPLAEEAVRTAEHVGEPWSLVDAYLGLGVLRLRQGEVDAARAVLENGVEICRRFSIKVWFPPLTSSLGHVYALGGKIPEAIALLRGAIEQATATQLRFYHSLSVIWLGEAYLLWGLTKEAADATRLALELCERYGEAGNRAYTLRLMARVAAAAPAADLAAAEAAFQRAATLAAELAMRPLVAQCRLDLGELLRGANRWPEARRELGLALSLFRDMGMDRPAARAQAMLDDPLVRG